MATLACFGTLLGVNGCVPREERNPDQSFALYQVALSSFEAGRLEAARGEADKALKADANNAEAHQLLGLIALREGAQYVAQVETMDCLTGQDATMVRVDANKRYRVAANHFRRAVEIQPEFATAWNNLAVASLNSQEWDSAIDAASNAIAIGNYAEPHVAHGNRGWGYYKKGDLQNAWRELHDSVSRQPGFCVGRYRLAKVLMDRDKFDDAALQIDAVLADKRCPIQEAHLAGGLLADRLGVKDRAVELFAECIRMAPRSCVAAECERLNRMIH